MFDSLLCIGSTFSKMTHPLMQGSAVSIATVVKPDIFLFKVHEKAERRDTQCVGVGVLEGVGVGLRLGCACCRRKEIVVNVSATLRA